MMNRRSLLLSFALSTLFVGAMTVAFTPITSYSSADSTEGCDTFYYSESPTWTGGTAVSTITDTSGNPIGEVVCFAANSSYTTTYPATTITTTISLTSTTTTTSMVTVTDSDVPTWAYGVMSALLIVGLAIGYFVRRPLPKS